MREEPREADVTALAGFALTTEQMLLVEAGIWVLTAGRVYPEILKVLSSQPGLFIMPMVGHANVAGYFQAFGSQVTIGPQEASPPEASEIDSFLRELASLGIRVVNPREISSYVTHHNELLTIVADVAKRVRRRFASMSLTLELTRDPEANEARTLLLYLRPGVFDDKLFEYVADWNDEIAIRMAKSKAWFLMNLDLRR